MSAPRRYFLLGPTAAGKTEVALALARRLGADIYSLDSMLVYRGMDIGTAKPSAEQRAAVPHFLLDLVPPSEAFSASRWVEAARAAETAATASGRPALYVGGTALYLKALLHGLPEGLEVPAAIRDALQQEWSEAEGPARLRAELERVDPVAAARIHLQDAQRTLRALGHARAFGQPWSSALAPWPGDHALGVPAVALRWPRAGLHARISDRFQQMMEQGLLNEVARLRADPGMGPTARRAIGYRHLLCHLEEGQPLAQSVSQAQRATRVLVRRQETWLRSFPDLRWIEADAASRPEDLAESAARAFTAES
jgi:tRNA dimethylallyltransferase